MTEASHSDLARVLSRLDPDEIFSRGFASLSEKARRRLRKANRLLRWGEPLADPTLKRVFREDGSVSVRDIHRLLFHRHVSADQTAVFLILYYHGCDKGRVRWIVEESGDIRFFATNGHSVHLWKTCALDPEKVFCQSSGDIEYAYHATGGDGVKIDYLKESIERCGINPLIVMENSRKSRIHAHGALELENTLRGCRLLYRVNLKKLTELGVTWWLTKGRVRYVLAERFPPECLELMTR